MMNITSADGHDWRQWVLVTSIPLVRLDECDTLVGFGSGTMIDHAGSRFIVAAEHVVARPLESTRTGEPTRSAKTRIGTTAAA